ncbi:MAG: DNA polymerase III subunit gamma/tau [Gammaproteobacteria bacterium]|nr:DNA polymerase III subunit gamma/tau [Gammaproteobacteria bacterium]MBU1655416.1 DNA polymerase III subunit gamma/tau [Gammaproteobacteria bacterium]MBU1962161.1 DNA polymerase III subunit gamma/tau [Gammaproteobacteria bacterium]
MSYQVLARKWRPHHFSEVVGQEHVVRALSNALDNDRLHHAYLFTGTRGVGKTTLARIFAKSLNCETGVGSTPCGVCGPCREIDEGRFVDLLEVDAASRTKVEQTRELLENVPYAPSSGRYKVYLIDEVHMFSDSSFNALLKTLEEPPPHVKFLLATTDPQKVPVTVLSRCLQFNLKRLPMEQLQAQLRRILEQEKVEFEAPALTILARAAAGSVRDALSLLDQSIAYGGGRVLEADVRTLLGVIPHERLHHVLEALATNDGSALMGIVAQMAAEAPDFPSALQGLLSLLHRLALAQVVPGALDDSEGDAAVVEGLAQRISPEDVQLYYQIGLTGQRDLPFAPDPRSGFEMVLLRMLAFRPADGWSVTAPAPERQRCAVPAKREILAKAKAAPPAEGSISDDWHRVVEAISGSLGGMATQLASNCVVDGWEGDQLRLILLPEAGNLASERTVERLQSALGDYYGRPVKLRLQPVGSKPLVHQAPAQLKAQERVQRQQEAERTIRENPYVQALSAEFDATVITDSIKPID